MMNTTITNFRNHAFDYINQAIDYNTVINVTTKKGNAVILSEADYNALMETLYISRNAQAKDEIIEGLKTPVEDCISADEVEW